MSSSEGNCLDQACQNCTQAVCTRFTESCTEQCETSCQENCQEACNQACQNACNQACQNACANATCTCGSSSSQVIFPLFSTVIIPFLGLLILGFIQAFDPSGPLYLTLFGSGFLALSLTGFTINPLRTSTTCANRLSEYKTQFGFIGFNHSHHSPDLISMGHEFKFKGKYFCTGCYGILMGICISIIIAIIYITGYFSSDWLSISSFVSVSCFIPIILRYKSNHHFGSLFRFLSNSLLPLGCCLALLSADLAFHSWGFNVLIVILILIAAYFRSIVGRNENQRSVNDR